MTDRMTDTFPCMDAVLFPSFKLPKTIKVRICLVVGLWTPSDG